jgi:mutator protein MutT
MRTNNRAVGIIIQNEEILLLRRVKNGQEYFVFPGGGVESEETIEEALIREMKEELSLKIHSSSFLFKISTQKNPSEAGRVFHFYLINSYEGNPQLAGPEKDKMCEDNQYYLEWMKISDLENTPNLFPDDAKQKLLDVLRSQTF